MRPGCPISVAFSISARISCVQANNARHFPVATSPVRETTPAMDLSDVLKSDSAVAQTTQFKRPAARSGRASVACKSCRKLKTRCFPIPEKRSCLRCKTNGSECSFLTDDTIQLEDDGVGTRLTKLEHNVNEILGLLRNTKTAPVKVPAGGGRQKIMMRVFPTHTSDADDNALPLVIPERQIPPNPKHLVPSFGQPSTTFLASPFNIYGSLSVVSAGPELANNSLPPPISRLYNPQMVIHERDIISQGYISEADAIRLLDQFRTRYNRWVSLPEDVPIEELLVRIRKRCSLLLTVCCCVAIRYSDETLRENYSLLLGKMQSELTQSLFVVPQTIEFMQALAIMAIYASSLSEGNFVIDAWYYSSIALEHFVTKDILGLVMSYDGVAPVTQFDEITAYRIWNHLCLVHLVNCVMSGRMCVIDEVRLDQCRRTLELPSALNFDGRMVAEISLQLLVYNFVQGGQSLNDIRADLDAWVEQWSYLFIQAPVQFVELSYHFCEVTILFYWEYTQQNMGHINTMDPSTVVTVLQNTSPETILELADHLIKIIDYLVGLRDDDYFACLSDQVHFYGAFSCITMTSIIQIMIAHNIQVPDDYVKESLKKVAQLGHRYRLVGIHPSDLVVKYGAAIGAAVAVVSQTI